jgi:hypothetical protein
MGREEVVVEYRGYLLIRRVVPITGTDRIKGPDGTWRYSPPTFVGEQWRGWVVARRAGGGAVEELAAFGGYQAALRCVDDDLQGRH